MSDISYYTALTALFAPLLLLVAVWSLLVAKHDHHVCDDTPPSDATSTGERTSEVSKVSNVPDEWFTSDQIFQLERRAIFSNSWLCITTTSHFHKPGDYLSFRVADYPFFIIMGKDRVLRGFHNVCRHRAYNVTRKVMGSSLVLGCRYHGWSYDTKGNLTKAPQFDEVPGFNRADNGLFQIWVRTDPNGFVFVNFDAKWDVFDPPSAGLNSFADVSGASKQSIFCAFWQAEGDFSWKQSNAMLASEYPELQVASSKSFFDGFIRSSRKHKHGTQAYSPDPISTLTALGHVPFWHMTVVEPISATKSSIRRTLYSTIPIDSIPDSQALVAAQEAKFSSLVEALEVEFAVIQSGSQFPSLTRPQQELGLQLQKHARLEREAGRKILPALPLQIANEVESSGCGIAEKLCRELNSLAESSASCINATSSRTDLSW